MGVVVALTGGASPAPTAESPTGSRHLANNVPPLPSAGEGRGEGVADANPPISATRIQSARLLYLPLSLSGLNTFSR